MFITHNDAEFSIASAMRGEGFHAWAHVTRVDLSNWFYAISSQEEDGSSLSTIWMLDSIRQVAEVNKVAPIKDLYMVSPPHKNKAGCWRMDRIRKISSAHENNEETPIAFAYELYDHSWGIENPFERNMSELEDFRVVLELTYEDV